MKETKTPLGTWGMGNIALFGAILMSNGITRKEKEALKKMMYQALTPHPKGNKDWGEEI